MTPTTPDPSDLAQLQATDALLDRLAAAAPTVEDRQDPLVAALVGLRAELDSTAGAPGLEMERLLEVLGDRPLFLVDDTEVELVDETGPIALPRETGAERSDRAAGSIAGAAYAATVRSINSSVHALAAGRRASHGRSGPAEGEAVGWYDLAHQMALPAASVVIGLLALGSGVSVAVTGDPMAPVSGVSRVVSQLPGISDQAADVAALNARIDRADALVRDQPGTAADLLEQAAADVDDLPADARAELNQKIEKVHDKLPGQTPAVAGPAASPSALPSLQPSVAETPVAPSASVTASSTAPGETASPSASPSVGGQGVDPTGAVPSSTSVPGPTAEASPAG